MRGLAWDFGGREPATLCRLDPDWDRAGDHGEGEQREEGREETVNRHVRDDLLHLVQCLRGLDQGTLVKCRLEDRPLLEEADLHVAGEHLLPARGHRDLSLIHISEPTRLLSISYAVF